MSYYGESNRRTKCGSMLAGSLLHGVNFVYSVVLFRLFRFLKKTTV
uniref:Uncharacterized protein n=1 Tax=Anguilla anguilla TaxID=7936 RepID=A0A0E9Q483_ANGAN